MTATIDGIVVTGSPAEIASLIKQLRVKQGLISTLPGTGGAGFDIYKFPNTITLC